MDTIRKRREIVQDLPKCSKGQEVDTGCWKNGTNSAAQYRVATSLPFVRGKKKQAKCNKVRYTLQIKAEKSLHTVKSCEAAT